MSQRYPGVIWTGDAGGDTRHNLKGDVCGGQFASLFATPAKNIRIPAFETNDALAGARFFHEQSAQFRLGNGMIARAFAGVNQFRLFGREPQQVQVYEGVVNHDIGPAQQIGPAHGD
jgi:hypothetical protein